MVVKLPQSMLTATDEELGPGGVQAAWASVPPGRRVTGWEGRMPRRFHRQLHPFALPPAVAGLPVALCSQQRSGRLAFQCSPCRWAVM